MDLPRLLAQIPDYTNDALIITEAGELSNPGPRIVYVNQAFVRLTGYAPEEVIGKTPRMLQGPKTDRETLLRIGKSLREQKPIVVEVVNYSKQKHEYWVELSISPVLNDQGVCTHFISIEKDITERRVMQEAAEQQAIEFLSSELRTRAILHSIVDGIITLSPNGIIESLSPAAERMFGQDALDLENMRITGLFAASSHDEIEAFLTNPQCSTRPHELQALHKNGNQFIAEVSVSRIECGQKPTLVMAVRDITEQKKLLMQMRMANLRAEATALELQEHLKEANELRKKAEEANMAKSNFLANMSHELRTPMNAMLGMCGLLLESPLDAEQMECARTVHGAGENLLALLNDILDISKVESGDLTLENVPFDISAMLSDIRKLFGQAAQERRLSFSLDADPLLPSCIMGDPSRLQQVLHNLISNALKFTPQGSVVLTVGMESAGRLRFAVTDTGIGIPEDKLGAIFDKFTQADASTTRKYGGTGLGLAITKELAQLMGGTITVESRVGSGSTFILSLPMTLAEKDAAPVNRAPAQAASETMALRDVRMLVVDDHPINLQFIRKLLGRMGACHIDTAENGREALALIAAAHYDIVFMDCQMPELDGYEATMALRQRESVSGGRHLPIIAMTANAMVGDREKCLHAGMDDYVSKPIRPAALTAVFARWLPAQESVDMPVAAATGTPAANENAPSFVDMEQFSLFLDGTPEERRDLADLFLSQAELNLENLRKAFASGEALLWKSAAHRFKGASANLGASKLAKICAAAETDYHAPAPHKQELLSQIADAVREVGGFLTSQVAA